MKVTLSLLTILLPVFGWAQNQSQKDCVTSVKARAGMTVSSAEAEKLCKENTAEVVDCTLTSLQGSRFSATYDGSVKACRARWYNTPPTQDTPAPAAAPAKSAAPAEAPKGDFKEL